MRIIVFSEFVSAFHTKSGGIKMRLLLLIVGTCLATSGAMKVEAQDIVFRPVNPSFGGNPLNSNHLLGIANSQRPEEDVAPAPTRTTSERFVQILESRLLSSLAFDVTDSIFGEEAQESGTIKFDTLTINFDNTGTEVEISILDEGTGQITEIIVPTTIQ